VDYLTQFIQIQVDQTIFIYDSYPGGIGFSKKGFDYIEKLIGYGYDVINNCKCEDGCPSCIYSPKCGNKNKPLDKKAQF